MIPTSVNPMKSLRRWAIGVGVALGLLVVTCTGLYIWGMQRRVAKLEQVSVAAEANDAADNTWREGHITYTKDREEAKSATDEALARNRSWADEPVPSDVADRLRKHTDPAR